MGAFFNGDCQWDDSALPFTVVGFNVNGGIDLASVVRSRSGVLSSSVRRGSWLSEARLGETHHDWNDPDPVTQVRRAKVVAGGG